VRRGDWLRGRLRTVCARVAWPAWSCGPSTSPLDAREPVTLTPLSTRRPFANSRGLEST
jgi:hypothetical protein